MARKTLDLLAEQARSALATQRAQADTAKLLVTFSAALAATLTASALQTGKPSWLDATASILLLGSFLLAVMVFVADGLDSIEVPSQLQQALARDASELDRQVKIDTLEAVERNRPRITRIRRIAFWQFCGAGVTGIAATLSFFTA